MILNSSFDQETNQFQRTSVFFDEWYGLLNLLRIAFQVIHDAQYCSLCQSFSQYHWTDSLLLMPKPHMQVIVFVTLVKNIFCEWGMCFTLTWHLFCCVLLGSTLKNSFIIIHYSRFKQTVGLYTLQAPSQNLKVTSCTWNFPATVGK